MVKIFTLSELGKDWREDVLIHITVITLALEKNRKILIIRTINYIGIAEQQQCFLRRICSIFTNLIQKNMKIREPQWQHLKKCESIAGGWIILRSSLRNWHKNSKIPQSVENTAPESLL